MMPLASGAIFQNPAVIAALAAAPVVCLAGLALGSWLKRRHQVPFGIAYRWFILALTVYAPLKTIHVIEHGTDHAAGAPEEWHDTGIRYFGSALIILGILTALALIRRYFWELWFRRAYGTSAPKLLQQVFGFAVFGTGTLMVMSMRHGVQVDAFLAGSGIAAVVIGFAMQETLANIVSGIALQIGKPFKTGDWLIVTDHRAEVVEVNWRSTRLRTNDDVYLDIPNKTIVTSTITNLSFPTKTHANRLRIGFDYNTPPNTVRDLLKRAAEAVPLILTNPPVKVFLRDFADSAITYEIKYSLEDESRFNDIEDAIRTNIWYEAKRAGITIPFPQRVIHIKRDKADDSRDRSKLRDLIESLDLFSALSSEQRAQLLEDANVLHFGRGESIIKQGSLGCSMFIVVSGELEASVSRDGVETRVGTLSTGDAFGEMCLLTGEARTATVRALTDSFVWEIRRDGIQPLVQQTPELAARMSELLARRKMHNDGVLAAQAQPHVIQEKTSEYASGLLRKIRSLFEI